MLINKGVNSKYDLTYQGGVAEIVCVFARDRKERSDADCDLTNRFAFGKTESARMLLYQIEICKSVFP